MNTTRTGRTGRTGRTTSPTRTRTDTVTGTGTGTVTGTVTGSLTSSKRSGSSKRRRGAESPAGAVCYHATVCAALLLAGGLLLALGVWAVASRWGRIGLLRLGGLYGAALRATGGVCIAFGVVALLAGVLGCVALKSSSLKYAFVGLGAVALIGLLLIAVVGWMLCASFQSARLRAALARAWNAQPSSALVIQAARRCVGFDAAVPGTSTGCYLSMTNLLFGVTLPTAFGTTVLALMLLIDLCVVFAL